MTLPGGRALAALACALVVLAGCGDDTGSGTDDPSGAASVSDTTGTDPSSSPTDPASSSSPTDAPSTPAATEGPKTEPTCESVWVDGKTFEKGYKGCFNGERWVKARPIYCSFGGRIFTYDAHFWATPNKPVHHARNGLAKDADYQQALGACTA